MRWLEALALLLFGLGIGIWINLTYTYTPSWVNDEKEVFRKLGDGEKRVKIVNCVHNSTVTQGEYARVIADFELEADVFVDVRFSRLEEIPRESRRTVIEIDGRTKQIEVIVECASSGKLIVTFDTRKVSDKGVVSEVIATKNFVINVLPKKVAVIDIGRVE